MEELLRQRAAELSQLAATLRTGLARAEAMIPGINQELDSLAVLGVTEFQVEGPTIYVRPAGVSSARDDSFIIYQAAIVMPGGIGAALWDAGEHTEYVNAPYGQPVDLAPRFVPFAKCPAIVKAMLVSQSARMLDCFIRDVRLLGS
jgi:hypothetical protein